MWDGTATNPGFRRTQRPFKVGLQRTSPMCPAFHRSPEFGFQAADATDVVGRLVFAIRVPPVILSRAFIVCDSTSMLHFQ